MTHTQYIGPFGRIDVATRPGDILPVDNAAEMAAACNRPDSDKTPIERELDALQEAIYGAERSAQWLLQRIAPVCQPVPESCGKDRCTKDPEVQSALRARIVFLRGQVEAIGAALSGSRFTIEI